MKQSSSARISKLEARLAPQPTVTRYFFAENPIEADAIKRASASALHNIVVVHWQSPAGIRGVSGSL